VSADARTAWNAVERLASLGEDELARDLAELLRSPAVADALHGVAEERGHAGGTGLAEESATAALSRAESAPLPSLGRVVMSGHILFGSPGGRRADLPAFGEGRTVSLMIASIVDAIRRVSERYHEKIDSARG
jgi:hypothetical protein